MRKPKLPNYLRTYRKRADLTQDQMAFLIGCRSGSKISRYERNVRIPGLRTVFALQAILNIPAHKLYEGVYEEVKARTEKRAAALARRLSRPTTPEPLPRHAR